MSRSNQQAELLPHSWGFKTWPPGAYPHHGTKARYLFRTNKIELIECGAVSRVGKEIIFLGAGYARFLQRHIARAAHLDIPPNRASVQ